MVLKFAVKDFLEDREFSNLSSHTIKNYRRILNSFHDYCVGEIGISNVTDVNRSVIKGFLSFCKNELGNNPQTINAKIRILKVFFNYLIEEGVCERDSGLFRNVKFSKVEDRIDTFTDSQIKQMLRYFDRQSRNKPFHAYRNKAIVITMLGTGIRLGEVCNLRWSDVDFEHDMISVFGKKRKSVSIPITSKLRRELADFFIYTKNFFDGNMGQYVFCTTKKKQLNPDTVASIFKRLKSFHNFEGVRLSPHTFRHTFASRALKNGMDAITLQRILRHETLQMTERYVNMWGSDLKQHNDKYNPLNDIEI